ncbi:MAG: hypothetical protein WA849_17165 [Candidatus Udaeobacter sp.]
MAVRLPVDIREGLSLFLLLLPGALLARPMEGATYQKMFNKADLVVIAKPLSTRHTEERPTLPGWEYVHVVGVNTEFEARLDPCLASFNPKQHNTYRLFLIKQPNGRYVPAGGQVDPAAFSVIKLSSVME